MIIYRCTNELCPRYGQRTEKVCQAGIYNEGEYLKGIITGAYFWLHCHRPARKDYS